MKSYVIYLDDKIVGFVNTPDQFIKPTSNILEFVETQKVYDERDVKVFSFWAAEYASKEFPNKDFRKSQIDNYLKTNFNI